MIFIIEAKIFDNYYFHPIGFYAFPESSSGVREELEIHPLCRVGNFSLVCHQINDQRSSVFPGDCRSLSTAGFTMTDKTIWEVTSV